MNNWNFLKSSVFFRIIILVILFLFNFSDAQEGESVTIFLGKGAKFYSADDSFNQQVFHKKIIIKNAHLSVKNPGTNEILVASAIHHDVNQNLAQQLKTVEELKRKQELKKVKEKIDSYEAKSKFFEKQDYKDSPSPSQFFSSHSTSKNYIAPSHSTNGFSKICTSDKNYSIKRALAFLHTQKFTFYNNKSLDFCFSEVFSVRPPPILG
ncbi:hypothetical protein NZ698_13530 [Chryseobacterium sp. PBS4-4]|uniref:Uncharacterized protein n=1 Tax=Chryseobacterium edaphi TaxID=2976532 RepID=A0ABT2W8A4_9FLAO|nr:hypothetical protein [Chryseobacterium edaphi]MCU7618225.1 hypothetical protein [Chryseobacterium edaphi]